MTLSAARLVAGIALLLGLAPTAAAQPGVLTPTSFVQFDGTSAYVEVPDSPDFSVATTGALTISAWLRPDALTMASTEGSGYVYWLGKGTRGQYEWALRMYSQDNTENPNRANRISFYVFNPRGGLGIGSYFQDPITPGEWIHVVAIADNGKTSIYKNGVFRRCDWYTAPADNSCQRYAQDLWITPQPGPQPLRMGTRDFNSFFQGGVTDVRMWNRPLSADEITQLYAQDSTPRDGLVAEYLFGEGSGDTAYDTAGGHDATMHGATWGSECSAARGGTSGQRPKPTRVAYRRLDSGILQPVLGVSSGPPRLTRRNVPVLVALQQLPPPFRLTLEEVR